MPPRGPQDASKRQASQETLRGIQHASDPQPRHGGVMGPRPLYIHISHAGVPGARALGWDTLLDFPPPFSAPEIWTPSGASRASLRRPKTAVEGTQKRPEQPNMADLAPRLPQDGPRGPQYAPRRLTKSPAGGQNCPIPEGKRTFLACSPSGCSQRPKRPKRPPISPQDGPRGPQEGPMRAQ